MSGKKRLGILFVPLLALLACNGDKEEEQIDSQTPDDVCLTNSEYFAQQVWWPTLAADCVGCHNSQGAAKDSKLVLQSSWQTGFLEHNYKVFQEVAAFEVNGNSIILQKPIGALEHGGNKRFENDSDQYNALKTMVERIATPVECGDKEKQAADDNLNLLSLEETLRKASLSLTGRLPTTDEYENVTTKGMEGFNAALDEMLKEEAFYDRLKEIYNDQLLTDRYVSGSDALNLLRDEDYPDREWYEAEANEEHENTLRSRANVAVAREPLELIAHVVRNDRPFSEIVTADYMMVNPYSARTYGVMMNAIPNGADPEDYDPAQFFEAKVGMIPHAGVLSSHMFLNRFPTTDTNVNRHRSRIIFDFFLATDVMKLADRPLDPTSIEEFNPTMYTPSCAICHAVIDPPAGSFQNWNDRGQYRPPENGWNQDMRPPGIGGKVMPHEQRFQSLQWLSKSIANDSRFATAAIHTWFKALTGREPIKPPSYVQSADDREKLKAFETQDQVFKQMVDAFSASEQNLKTVIKLIVASPYYRATSIRAQTTATATEHSYGTGRLLTPEMLHRKVRAVTDIRWRRSGRDVLLSPSEFLYFYGGIDSDQVTQRISSPNGIMANIAQRMANEVACRAVSRDFVRNPEQRLLFPMTERGYVPQDENGFEITEAVGHIKTNIRHLHRQILGEFLPANDPEIERTYQLFLETWLEGKVGLMQEIYSQDLPSECRTTINPDTGEELNNNQRITRDSNYTVRAWMSVVTYMLSDVSFLYE